MFRWVHMLLFTLLAFMAPAQNMVPNPSFEEHGEAPCSWVVSQETFNDAFRAWIMPTSGSTDMFSSLVDPVCYASSESTNSKSPGEQAPRTGDIMAALWTYGKGCVPSYREYLEVKLTEPMIPGFMYYAEFYVSCADNMRYASNNLGIHFSKNLIYNESLFGSLKLEPQINHTEIVNNTEEWVKISGTIMAVEFFEYIVIGNFFDDENTLSMELGGDGDDARYFIDDILVKCLTCITFNPQPQERLPKAAYVWNDQDTSGFFIHHELDGMLPRKRQQTC